MLLPYSAIVLTLSVVVNQPVPQAAADDGRIVATDLFVFSSHFELNMHDFLYYQAQRDTVHALPDACARDLSEAEKTAWDHARRHYAADMGRRHHRTDSLMRALRYELGGLDWDNPGVDLSEIRSLLDGASATYRSCWWTAHDEGNRAWAKELAANVVVYQDTLRRLFESYFMEEWSGKIPVDVVTYASWAGANTVPEPAHIMMSSVNRKYKSYNALEMVFHEAAHLIMHNGKISPYAPDAPGGAWHAILFYTAGEVTSRVLASDGVEYESYMDSYNVFGRWHEALERHWRPYLDGEAGWDESVRAVVAAVTAE